MFGAISAKAALCIVGCLNLIASLPLLLQFPVLFGGNGLQPISAYLNLAAQQVLPEGSSYAESPWPLIWSNPTLLWLHPFLGTSAETMFVVLCAIGSAVSAAAACGMVLHPVSFTMLWLVHLSAAGVGQAFLPQPGDSVLLEVTFACIFLSAAYVSLSHQLPQKPQHKQQPAADQPGAEQQAQGSKWTLPAPAKLLMRWLLFKLLLISFITRVSIACSGLKGLAGCYRIMVSHGQPHVFTWLSQGLPGLIAAVAAGAPWFELAAAFSLLAWFAPVTQKVGLRIVLVIQAARALFGSMGLLNVAAVGLCVATMEDSVLGYALAWLNSIITGKPVRSPLEKAATSEHATGDGNQQGTLQRSDSNCSLFSIDLDEAITESKKPGMSAGNRLALGVALFAVGNSMFRRSSIGLELRPLAQHLVAQFLAWFVLLVVVVWLGVLLWAAWQSCKQAKEAADKATEILAAKSAAAAAAAGAQPALAATGTAAAVGLSVANGMVSPALPPIATTAAAAKASARGAAAPAGPDSPMAAEESEGSKAAGGRRRASAKAEPSGTPRKHGRAKVATAEAEAAGAEPAAATPTKRGAGARGKKAAAAAAAAAAPAGSDDDAAGTEAPAAAAATPAAPAAAPSPIAAKKAPAVAVKSPAQQVTAGHGLAAVAGRSSGKQPRQKPYVGFAWAVFAAAGVLGMFLAGMPSVLVPAGWPHATLKPVIGLLRVYQNARNFGIVSSGSSSQLAWQATAAAAADLPGSYLVFEVSTSEDGVSWQPVRFHLGLGSVGLGGPKGSWRDVGGALRGFYEPRLQGRLAAAGSGSLSDNMWLLSLADKILEGTAELSLVLQDPSQPHNMVRIDLMRYSPTSLPAHQQQGVQGVDAAGSGWHIERVAEVLPVMSRGDADLKEALTDLGWTGKQPAETSAVLGAMAGVNQPLLLAIALLAVVARHCLFRGGLIYGIYELAF